MKRALTQFLFGGPGTGSALGDFGLLVLRITFGAYIALHGWGKIYSNGSFGLNEQLVSGVTAIGFPAPTFFAWCAALAEFLGGILVALGFLTRPAALALVFNMGVAAFKVHGEDPFYVAGPGRSKEAALLYLAAFVVPLLAGAGRFSIDRFLRPRPKRAETHAETK
jgi:putative oxidoreductase